MTIYPELGSPSCPDLILGLGVIYTPNNANDYEDVDPTAFYLVRHCNGAYTSLGAIAVPGMNSSPPLLSARTVVVSQFSSDPAGTLYVGDSTRTATPRAIPIGSIGAFPKPAPR